MKKIIIIAVLLLAFTVPTFGADLTVTLTTERANALLDQDVTKYLSDYADYLISKKAADEKYQLIKVLVAKTPTELSAAAKPIIDAEKAKEAALGEVAIPK